MASTTNITAGVKIIKIARQDDNGLDLTLQLQEAKYLRIEFDDLGIQEFEIESIAEYPNYYLYFIKPHSFGVLNSTFPTPTTLTSTTGGAGAIVDGNIQLPGSGGSLIKSNYLSGFFTSNNQTNFSFNPSTGQFTSLALKQPYTYNFSYTGSVWTDNNSVQTTLGAFISGSNLGTQFATTGLTTIPSNNSGSSNAVTFSGSIVVTVPPLTVATFGLRLANYYGNQTFYIPTSSFQLNVDSYVTSLSLIHI